MKKLGKVICNSSPIIGLSILGVFDSLWQIFDEVLVTEAVYREVVIQGDGSTGANELKKAVKEGNVQIYSVQDELFVRRFLGKLHQGELEVIAAAKELKASYLLIDDKAARSLAEALLLEPTGLIGFLKIAKLSEPGDGSLAHFEGRGKNGLGYSLRLANYAPDSVSML